MEVTTGEQLDGWEGCSDRIVNMGEGARAELPA